MRRLLILVIGLVIGVAIGASAITILGLSTARTPAATGQTQLVTPDEQNTVDIAAKARFAVVEIPARIEHPATQEVQQSVPQFIDTIGSGFFYEPNRLLTNYHVVGENASVTVVLFDGRELQAQVIGRDLAYDLAVLSVNGTPAPAVLPLGSSGDLQVGQKIIAIGNPFGLESSVTTGVVSGTGRKLPTPDNSNAGLLVTNAIQTDTPINPGNSGGPLLDSSGRVVGIATSLVTPSNTFSGIAMAVPIDLIKSALPDLTTRGSIPRPWMGVTAQTVDASLAKQLNLSIDAGALVQDVAPGSPAAQAGIRPASGSGGPAAADIITAIDNQKINTADDLVAAILEHNIGDQVTVKLVRQGSEVSVTLVLVEKPKLVALLRGT